MQKLSEIIKLTIIKSYSIEKKLKKKKNYEYDGVLFSWYTSLNKEEINVMKAYFDVKIIF